MEEIKKRKITHTERIQFMKEIEFNADGERIENNMEDIDIDAVAKKIKENKMCGKNENWEIREWEDIGAANGFQYTVAVVVFSPKKM